MFTYGNTDEDVPAAMSPGVTTPFILKIDLTGAIDWYKLYEFGFENFIM